MNLFGYLGDLTARPLTMFFQKKKNKIILF